MSIRQQPLNALTWVKSDGVVQGPSGRLAAGTYYADCGGSSGPWQAVQAQWDASAIATVTFDATNLPIDQLDVHATNADNGLPGWDPITAAGTLSIPGGAAGTDVIYLGGGGQRRVRAVAVVGTAGQVLLWTAVKD